jgi:O-antigen/teichoic acid export membrane protein
MEAGQLFKTILTSKLFKSTGIYTITSIINASIPFLLIPILTRKFTEVDYGIVAMVAIIINVITPFVGLSSNGAISRKYFDLNQQDLPRYVGNTFILLIFSTSFFAILFIILGEYLGVYVGIPSEWLFVLLIISAFQFISLVLLSIWQAQVKPISYGTLQIAQSVLNIGISLVLIYSTSLNWKGRILGQLIAVSVVGIYSIYYLYKNKLIRIEYNKSDLQEILKFSLPIVPHVLGGLVIAFTDRILITNMIGIKETGIYTVGYQLGSVITLLCSSFASAYMPWLFDNLNKNDQAINLKIVKLTYFYFIILLVAAVLSYFLLPFIINIIVGKAFNGVSAFIFWIVLANCFNGMYYLVTLYIFYTKNTSKLARNTFLLALINIPLTYFFIKIYGYTGAVFSMLLIFVALFFSTWILSAKVYKMPWFFFLQKRNL